MAAQIVWGAYILLAFAAAPLVFRLRFGRWPFAQRVPPRDAYGWIDAAYGVATGVFTLGVLIDARPDPPPPLVLAGVLVAAASWGLQAWAVAAMGPSWRIGQDRDDPGPRHVASGPFSVAAHPIYMSLVGMAAAMALLRHGDVWSVSFLLVTAVYTVVQGPAETRHWRSRRR